MPHALHGISVLDLSETVAGQFCGRMFADYGADVLLAEPPDGSIIRRQPPFDESQSPPASFLFFHCNHGKKSLTFDRASATGHALLLTLVAQADVVIVGHGVDKDELARANPNAIIAQVTSFGEDGPYKGWRGTEMVHMAMSGMMNHNGLGDREPLYGCGNRSSYAAGICAYISAVAGLYARKAIGRGQQVNVDALEVASSMCYPYATQHVYNGWLEPRGERGQPFAVLRCKDGWVAIWIHEQHWEGACRALDLAGLSADARFVGAATRQSNWNELVAIMQSRTREWSADDVVSRLQAQKVIAAKAWRPTELVHACQHLSDRSYWETVSTGNERRLVLGPQFRMSVTPRQLRGGAPEKGESNERVYAASGLDHTQAEAL